MSATERVRMKAVSYTHLYLGVNSVLGRYQAAALNGRSMVPFLSLGEGI